MVLIRNEQLHDVSAIRHVNERAFNGFAEANLVELIRAAEKAIISFVAIDNENVVGHILFSRVTVGFNPHNIQALGLAPMAVLPEYQRQGIGSELVRRGLEECRRQGFDLVFVLGHTKFYSRFGFTRASVYGFDNEYNADESFMVLELRDNKLNTASGMVKFQPEFQETDC
jgi:putative acetyltransferase